MRVCMRHIAFVSVQCMFCFQVHNSENFTNIFSNTCESSIELISRPELYMQTIRYFPETLDMYQMVLCPIDIFKFQYYSTELYHELKVWWSKYQIYRFRSVSLWKKSWPFPNVYPLFFRSRSFSRSVSRGKSHGGHSRSPSTDNWVCHVIVNPFS